MAKILLVEDDKMLAAETARFLQATAGYTVETVFDGQEALDRLKLYTYDAVVLDWSLPLMTGVEVCRTYRRTGGQLPILFLTGKDTLADKEAGFTVGADDYLTKPFDLRELSLRIQALLRRPHNIARSVYKVGHISIDTNKRQVFHKGVAVRLTDKEYLLLELLLRNPGRILTVDEILNSVWSSESDVAPGAVRTHMSRLKSKIADSPDDTLISNVHGRGYMLTKEIEQEGEL